MKSGGAGKTSSAGRRLGGALPLLQQWLKEKFGSVFIKVIVDAGFTCPNRDGSVCGRRLRLLQQQFVPPSVGDQNRSDPDQVRDGIEYIRKRFEANKFIIYFQPFSNTYAETGYLQRLYTEAIDHPMLSDLRWVRGRTASMKKRSRCSTRSAAAPSCRWSSAWKSIYDDTLRRVNRGHDYAAFVRAMQLTRGRSLHIGAHLILGFPWETRDQWLAMADEMSLSGINALKIHHLHWCAEPRWRRNTRAAVSRAGV
jgi:radical SAM superfamily enzyme